MNDSMYFLILKLAKVQLNIHTMIEVCKQTLWSACASWDALFNLNHAIEAWTTNLTSGCWRSADVFSSRYPGFCGRVFRHGCSTKSHWHRRNGRLLGSKPSVHQFVLTTYQNRFYEVLESFLIIRSVIFHWRSVVFVLGKHGRWYHPTRFCGWWLASPIPWGVGAEGPTFLGYLLAEP